MSALFSSIAGVLLCSTLLALASCAAVPAPMLANAGVNMAANSGGMFVSGSMENTFALGMEPVCAATLDTAETLHFALRRHSSTPTSCTYYLTPQRGDAIRVRIIQHTPTVTTISIRVGLLGDQNLSRFLLGEVERRLPDRPPETQVNYPPSGPPPAAPGEH